MRPLTIGELSSQVGVSAQTLRDWEAKGLVVPDRTPGGQRRYTADHVDRAARVAQLRSDTGWNSAAIKTSLGADARPMPTPWNGDTVRQARLAQGWTVERAAKEAGISTSHLTAIERSETGASTKVVAQIADAFQIPMSALSRPRSNDTTVLRRAERVRGELADGVIWEELALPGHRLEPALLSVPPGAGSGGSYSRPGETFAHVLVGQMAFTIETNDVVTVLDVGDSIIIPATTAYSWTNPGTAANQVMWVEHLTSSRHEPESVALMRAVRERKKLHDTAT